MLSCRVATAAGQYSLAIALATCYSLQHRLLCRVGVQGWGAGVGCRGGVQGWGAGVGCRGGVQSWCARSGVQGWGAGVGCRGGVTGWGYSLGVTALGCTGGVKEWNVGVCYRLGGAGVGCRFEVLGLGVSGGILVLGTSLGGCRVGVQVWGTRLWWYRGWGADQSPHSPVSHANKPIHALHKHHKCVISPTCKFPGWSHCGTSLPWPWPPSQKCFQPGCLV